MSVGGLNPAIPESGYALHSQFETAQPFRHLVIDDLLDETLFHSLVNEFPAFDEQHALNEYGEVGGKAVRPDLPQLGPGYARFDALVSSREFLDWLSQATGIPHLLYDADYVGGGTHENANGQSLDPHVDFNFHTNGYWHRRLNLILFLNDRWEPDWGGCLELHTNPWLPADEDQRITVRPQANRAVIFETTERSWHGFPRINLPEGAKGATRRSVAVYFYTEQRGAEVTVPDHGTYYVPRPFPSDISVERPLTTTQIAELKELFEQRNRQIRHLWESERELRQHLQRINHSPSIRLAQALTWPVRKLRDAFRRG